MFLNNVGSVEEAIKRVCVCVWEKEGMVKDPGAVQHRACSVHGTAKHFSFSKQNEFSLSFSTVSTQ